VEDLALLRTAIKQISNRPRMFLTRLSLKELDTFLSGFCYGFDVGHPLTDGFHGSELRLFQEWLVVSLSGDKNISWSEMVLTAENGDDEAAYSRFFTLWDEFLKSTASERPFSG
jgi:hypothetical protein